MVMVDANKIEDYILCTWGLGSGPNVKAQTFVRIKPPIQVAWSRIVRALKGGGCIIAMQCIDKIQIQSCLQSRCKSTEGGMLCLL